MPICGDVRIARMVIALAGAACMAAAQERVPADIAKEPHHRLLLENELVRVFAVTIPPHQESYVRHEHNFLTVVLQDGEVVKWRAGESDVMHFPVRQGDVRCLMRGDVLGMRNESNAEYRDITVEFPDPGVTNYGYRWETGKWDYGSSAINGPMDPHARFVNQLNLEMAIVSDVQLSSKDSLDAPIQDSRELVIAVTPLELRNGNDAKIRLAPGEVVWLDRRVSSLVNTAAVPARFVLVAFKAPEY
jgi:hypothetical protein